MRTTINIDDDLMATALGESGLRSKQAAVEEGLRALVRREAGKKLRAAFGKYLCDGDLSEQRRSWRRH